MPVADGNCKGQMPVVNTRRTMSSDNVKASNCPIYRHRDTDTLIKGAKIHTPERWAVFTIIQGRLTNNSINRLCTCVIRLFLCRHVVRECI